MQVRGGGVECHRLVWTSLSPAHHPADCWPVGPGHGHWYGAGETVGSRWPLDSGQPLGLTPFVTGDSGAQWGSVIRKFFINSKGVSMTVEDATPLSVSLGPDGLCVGAHSGQFPYNQHAGHLPVLNYSVCTGENLTAVYESGLVGGFWEGHEDSDLAVLNRLLRLPLWQLPARSPGPQGYTAASVQSKNILRSPKY